MSTVTAKYLKDENGNTISPITGAGSVYTSDSKSVQEKVDDIYDKIGDVESLLSEV